jgi:D-alanyl-D-alanine carboxypeptidase
MTKKFFGFILLLIFSVNLYAFSSGEKKAANYQVLKQKLQTKLDDWHKNADFAGATIGVTMPNGDSFGLATGYSDRIKKTPMKSDDFMLAGSVGKTYVSAVALQLIEKRKINLDDKAEKYLGDEKWFVRLPNARDITIRQLMSHTSGLVRYEFNDKFIKDMLADVDRAWKPRELVAYLLDTKPPFEAGKGWEYSDTNYIVLGIIIEKVTGKTYYSLAQKNVLKPLKLKHTKPQISREIKGLIQGYAGKNNPFGGEDEVIKNGKFIFNPQWEWTGGGMVTTSEDLARWAKAKYESRVFSKEMLAEMLKGVDSPQLGPGAKYGLGVIIRPTPLGITYGHSGFFPGYFTDMMYFPEHEIAVAIQINSSVPKDIRKRPSSVLVELFGVIKDEPEVKKKVKTAGLQVSD